MTFSDLALLLVVLLLATYVLTSLHYRRLQQHASWPQAIPSLLWGHLQTLHETIKIEPADRHIDVVFGEMRKRLGSPPVMFLDLRPASYPTLVVCNHEVAEQITRITREFPSSLPKSPGMKSFVNLIGLHSILTADGDQWKALRKRFNPGFAPQHLMTLLPHILFKTWPFLHNLDSYALTGEAFRLGDLCVALTFDIIGAVAMDLDFHAQLDRTHQSELIQLYHELARSCNEDHGRTWPWSWLANIIRQRQLSKNLDTVIKRLVRQKFNALRDKSSEAAPSRSILALSLRDTEALTPLILDQTCDQLKSFLFAGHDTTSIVLQWAFYELGRTPKALAALRAELDDVFGMDPDPAVVREILLERGEEVFPRLRYTSAVIKETLRLYPPAGTARMAPVGSGAMIHVPGLGERCIDGLVVYNSATIIQRDEKVYGPSANDFVPERWLGHSEPSYDSEFEGKLSERISGKAPAGAWRPFERGPRSCIGQELANIEVKVILACTARRYDFKKVGLGELAVDRDDQPVLNAKGQYEVKSHLYNTREVTAKPVDGTYVTVKLTPKASAVLRDSKE